MCRHMWITKFDECTCNVPDSAWVGEHTMRTVVFFPLFLSLLARYHAIYSTVWLFWAFACVMKLPFVTTYCGFQASPTFFICLPKIIFNAYWKIWEKNNAILLSYWIFFILNWNEFEWSSRIWIKIFCLSEKNTESVHWNFITF